MTLGRSGLRSSVQILILWLALATAGLAEPLPIRIDSSRNGEVYVRVVGDSGPYRKISDRTPATYKADPGQRIDIRVLSQDGFLWEWSGHRQGTTAPANITVRLERGVAWTRVAGAAGGFLVIGVGALLGWRKKTAQKIAAIERRARVAESGGGIPKRIAHYTIVEALGEGGMANVYRGQDQHGVDYAIKVPKTVDERFLRECTIATTIESPHIVKGFDFQAEKTEETPAYLAQEYLLGETLEARLAGTQGLPLEEVGTLFSQLLDGLEVAHSQSILHRDLKPENIFLDKSRPQETLKILDFGVAKAEDSLVMTVSGQVLGTALYASPEQNRSEKLDQRSDLYSAGLILYEMLTGQRTWNAANRMDLMKLHNVGLEVPPKQLRGDLPESWNQLVCELLLTDPGLRPNSVLEVKERWLAIQL